MAYLSLFTVLGCSTFKTQSDVIALQKARIQKLEKLNENNQKKISNLKNKLVIQDFRGEQQKQSLSGLRTLMDGGAWVQALKQSSELKKMYPRSIVLRQYRSEIFAKLGLNKQAAQEHSILRKLTAQKNRNGLSR